MTDLSAFKDTETTYIDPWDDETPLSCPDDGKSTTEVANDGEVIIARCNDCKKFFKFVRDL